MRRTLFALLCICGGFLLVPVGFPPHAMAAAMTGIDTPVGSWLRADGRTVFFIEPCATGLCGIIGGFVIDNPSDPPPMDWRGQPMCGDKIITVSPEYGARNKWHGTIVNPHDGNVWQATLTLINGTLQLRGYFGVPLFGKTETWTRYTGQIGPHCRLIPAG